MHPLTAKEKNTAASLPQPTREAQALLVQLLIKSGLFLQRELNQVCQHYGLNTNQFSVINEIIVLGPVSQKDLCERLLFEKSHVSKIVKNLLDKSLISVSVAPNDRRSTLLIETDQGAELWESCLESFANSSTELMSILSDEETGKTLKLIKKLERAFVRSAVKQEHAPQ
jgi:MarR family 2-MHQ and catechol resistance regulon transcriptional repressor